MQAHISIEMWDTPGTQANLLFIDVLTCLGSITLIRGQHRILQASKLQIGELTLAQNASRQKSIAVDFDGVIANYDGWVGGSPGEPRADVVEALSLLKSEGWKIIVHSCRDSKTLDMYLRKYNIPFDIINPGSPYSDQGGKPVATVYWDDRACKYSGNALEDINLIREFRTWSGRE